MNLNESLQRAFGDAYTIERELGGGGMSRVFLARDNALNRQVVVKVLPQEMSGQVSLDRFRREIGIAARLQQAHLVPLLSAGEVDGIPFFVMPYVDGEALRARLDREGELPLAEAVRILRDVASALAYSHSHGVVHRDIKPENVLLSGGAAMVTDFGVAKAVSESRTAGDDGITDIGVTLGTPAYMAPEQVTADPHIDFRADVYSWGVIAYELLTGQTPFSGRSAQGMLAAHVTEAPESVTHRRGSTPPALATLVMRCLEKRPADRPQNAEEIVRTLDAIGPLGGTQPALPASRRASRTGVFLLVGAIVLLAIAAGAYATLRTTPGNSAIQSIAVMPVATRGGDSTDYFADGIIETLIAALAKVPNLEVRPSASSLALKDRHLTDAEVGKTLNVQSILHVSVRRAAPMMRIIVDLARVKDGKVLWTDQQERPLTDVFAVQDSVASHTANALAIHLAASDRARVGAFGTHSLAAYDYFLRARHAITGFDEASLHLALTLLDSALVADPRYAQAYESMAEVWINLSDDWVAPRIGYANAIAAGRHALEIDSTASTARGLMAVASVTLNRDFRNSLDQASRAYRDDSLRASSVYPYAGVLSMSGKLDSAAFVGERAIRLDPISPVFQLVTGWTNFYFARPESALAHYRKAIDLAPEYPPAWNGMAEVLLQQGKPAEALAALQHGAGEGSAHQSTLARTLVALGRTAEAKRVTAELVADASRHYVSGDYIAGAYVALGNRDEAMRWLERANNERSQWIMYARSDPRWRTLHDDPRFKALVASIGP